MLEAKSFETENTLAEVTFPSHNAAEYIEHAQLLAMDYPNMLTAVAVRNNRDRLIATVEYRNRHPYMINFTEVSQS